MLESVEHVSYILLFLMFWWGLSFVLACIASIPTHFLLGWDLLERPIPFIAVALISFFIVFHLLIGGVPFLSGSNQSMVPTMPSQPEMAPTSKDVVDSSWTHFYRESQGQFWIGIVLSIPLGIGSSLIASWIYGRVKRQ